MHCLRVSGANIVLVDEEEGCQRRIDAKKDRIEEALQMKIIFLSGDLKRVIAAMPTTRPDDSYRKNVKGNTPIGLFYTRYLTLLRHVHPRKRCI